MGWGRPTRWLAPSRFPAVCDRCGEVVAPGDGQVRFDGAQWVVRHLGGRCHTRLYIDHVGNHSENWQRVREARMEFAGHRCEHHGWLSGRCRVVAPLQCHHRHYRTLGHERLKDVVMLCADHHDRADRWRRAFGTWPLLGRPSSGTWRPGDAPRGPSGPPTDGGPPPVAPNHPP